MANRTEGKKKTGRRNSFRAFGTFLALHLMKKKYKHKVHEAQAIEAGFIDKSGNDKHSSTNDRADKNTTIVVNDGSYVSTINNGGSKNGEDLLKNGKAQLLNGSVSQKPLVPGVLGLFNHGNTCFMNTIIQCLSNTDALAEYFVMGRYKDDLKIGKRDKSKRNGSKGEITQQLATVIKSLWMGSYNHAMTKTLKEVISKYATQYKGNSQHDSQEFLLWILDKLHEDLSIQKRKKSLLSRPNFKTDKKNNLLTNGSTNGQMANNNPADLSPTSFIQKLFQAHYDTSITCPACHKACQTKEPFLCVSLPVGQRTTCAIYVTVISLANKRRSGMGRKRHTASLLRIGIAAPTDGKVLQLRQLVSAERGIHSRLLVFADVTDVGFGKCYGDDDAINQISKQTNPQMSPLHVFQMPPLVKMKAGTLPRNFVSRHKKQLSKESFSSRNSLHKEPENIALIVLNREGNREKGKTFGRPLVFRVLRDISSSDLQTNILSQMSDMIKHGMKLDNIGELFDIQVCGIDSDEITIQDNELEQPLLSKAVDDVLEKCSAGGPLHVKLIAEWDAETREAICSNFTEITISDHDSVRLQRVVHQQQYICSLDECFELHTKEEEIDCENARQCPQCHVKQHGDKMKLSFYSLPEILIVNLKRFQVTGGTRTKLHTRVEFPITGLNLSPHKLANGSTQMWPKQLAEKDNIYDLYAMCNHFGNLNSGHYTACCCNPIDGKWYLFDDTKTEVISDEKLSQQPVYILFYQRRTSPYSNAPTSCNGGGSMTSLASDHWAYSLPLFQHKRANSQSALNQYAVNTNQPIANVNNNNKITPFPVQRYHDKRSKHTPQQRVPVKPTVASSNTNSSNNTELTHREIAEENGRRFSAGFRSQRLIRSHDRNNRKSIGEYPMQRQRSLKSRQATQL